MSCDNFTSDEFYRAGQELAASGKYAEALEVYSLAIARNSAHVQARCGRGLAFQCLGDHPRAIADFEHVISCYPNWPGVFVAYYGRALSRQISGANAEAIEDCDEALGRDPDLTEAIYLRGIARKALGHIEAAIRDMDAVIAVDPSYHEAYCVRGSLYYLQRHWRQAIEDFTAAVEQNTDRTKDTRKYFYLRGMAAQEQGDHRAAIADFTRAIELAPNDADAYLRRSRSYGELGERRSATADLQIGTRLAHGQ